VSLQDGAGLYQLDVVDSSGRVLQTLIRKSLTGPEQVWVQWDGKDAQGRNLPLGNYSLLCSKDGQVLRTMNLPEN
jgi:flagellar hook assembly protein FlgD